MFTDSFAAGYWETIEKTAKQKRNYNPGGIFAAMRSRSRQIGRAAARNPKVMVAGSLLGGGATGAVLMHKVDEKERVSSRG